MNSRMGVKAESMSHMRYTIARDAIEILLSRLDNLPQSERRHRLQAKLLECACEIERTGSSRDEREPDALMTRLLALHVDLVRLEREPADEEDAGRDLLS